MELFRSTFLIRPENFAKAAEAIRAAGIRMTDEDEYESDRGLLNHALTESGLFATCTSEGGTIFNCDRWMSEETVGFMEQVFKAVSRSVEPGGYVEFIDGENITRYVFLFDTVERWTVPCILYAQKEAI